jgi:hypothetical protein
MKVDLDEKLLVIRIRSCWLMVDGCWEICESAVVFPIYSLDTTDRFKKSVIRKIRLIGKSIKICESVAKKFSLFIRTHLTGF